MKKEPKKPLHPFDVWPPAQKKKEQQEREEEEEKKPKNPGFKNTGLEEHALNEPVYDAEEEKDAEVKEEKTQNR